MSGPYSGVCVCVWGGGGGGGGGAGRTSKSHCTAVCLTIYNQPHLNLKIKQLHHGVTFKVTCVKS